MEQSGKWNKAENDPRVVGRLCLRLRRSPRGKWNTSNRPQCYSEKWNRKENEPPTNKYFRFIRALIAFTSTKFSIVTNVNLKREPKELLPSFKSCLRY